jgi:hypothetical protein
MIRMGFCHMKRRRLLLRAPVVALAVGVVDAVWIEPHWLEGRRLRLNKKRDTDHSGLFTSRTCLTRVIERWRRRACSESTASHRNWSASLAI